VLVTLDKDFGELAIVRRQRHRRIVRLVGFAAAEQGPACREAVERHSDVLLIGGIVTVERGRVRVRPPEE
jgi:predicted nuclease of predicted toxin-antitoxin system